MRIKITFLILFFVLFCFQAFGLINKNPQEEFVFWLEKTASGLDDINQYMPSSLLSKEIAIEQESWLASQRKLEKHIFFEFVWLLPMGIFDLENCPLAVNTKKIPSPLISKVLSRKAPIINSFFENHKTDLGVNLAKNYNRNFFTKTPHTIYGYLEYIQLALLIQLIANTDLRFKVEATDLLQFISPHNPAKFNYFNLTGSGLIKYYLEIYLKLF